ncbi:DUF6155 family protein [Psychrobacillus sp. L4]|uniref:DUF6155 family protein n=1 Tax=Psychrobacillus sp. L4 TaxID=3236892 RepID=UPI0036F2AFF9
MSKLTLSELKKELKQYDQKELTQLIVDLYKLNDDVKIYLGNRFKGEEAIVELFEAMKRKITDEFFPINGFGKMRLKEAKEAITNFKKLSNDQIKTIDLMLYYVEIGTKFTKTYGDIDGKFYSSMANMFNKVADACVDDEQTYNIFADRLSAVVDESNGVGWGYHDALCDIYGSIEWTWEDEGSE